jgi:hypothetical protein
MPSGGKRAPDGRQPTAPGVGANSARHDLEAPATPGLGGGDKGPTDLQSGDVQELEAGLQVAPIGSPPRPRSGSSKNRRNTSSTMEAPDPIDFIGGRSGGQGATDPGAGTVPLVDSTPWLPFIRTVASAPGSGGAVGAALVRLLSDKRRVPLNPRSSVLDRQELDRLLLGE